MAAHRYWRLRRVLSYSDAALELAELRLTLSGVSVDGSAVLSSSVPPLTGDLASLKDGSAASSARFDARANLDFTWDFGGPQDVDGVATKVGLAPSEGLFFTTLMCSDDGITWAQVAPVGFRFADGPKASVSGILGWSVESGAISSQLLFSGVDGGTAVLDDVAVLSWSFNGSAVLQEAGAYWAPTSLRLSGSNASVSTPANSVFSPGSADFYLRVRFKVDSYVNLYQTLLGNGTPIFSNGCTFLMVYGDGIPAVGNRRKLAFGGQQVDGMLNPMLVSDVDVSTGVYHVAEVYREGHAFYMKLDGVVVAAYVTDVNNPKPVLFGQDGTIIGRNGWDGDASQFPGVIAELIFAKGSSTPRLIPWSDSVRPPKPVRLTRTIGLRLSMIELPGSTPTNLIVVPCPAPMKTERNFNFSRTSRGRIVGTVKRKADPANIPLRRRVRLYRDRDGLLIQETWSDAVTGAYEFRWFEEWDSYSVVADDYTGNLRSVVASRLTVENGGVTLLPLP